MAPESFERRRGNRPEAAFPSRARAAAGFGMDRTAPARHNRRHGSSRVRRPSCATAVRHGFVRRRRPCCCSETSRTISMSGKRVQEAAAAVRPDRPASPARTLRLGSASAGRRARVQPFWRRIAAKGPDRGARGGDRRPAFAGDGRPCRSSRARGAAGNPVGLDLTPLRGSMSSGPTSESLDSRNFTLPEASPVTWAAHGGCGKFRHKRIFHCDVQMNLSRRGPVRRLCGRAGPCVGPCPRPCLSGAASVEPARPSCRWLNGTTALPRAIACGFRDVFESARQSHRGGRNPARMRSVRFLFPRATALNRGAWFAPETPRAPGRREFHPPPRCARP